MMSIYLEAVFNNGREKIKPIEESFGKIAEVYKSKPINDADGSRAFYKDESWKYLEKNIIETMGVRYVDIAHMSIKSKIASKPYLNCTTYVRTQDRFFIDALVNENGFYDTTHTLSTMIDISMELFEICTPAEITALFLHEMGHNIDPAVKDIKYAGTNALIDYLIEGRINNNKNTIKNALKTNNIGSKLLLNIMGMYDSSSIKIMNFFDKLFSSPKVNRWNNAMDKIKQLLNEGKERNKSNNKEMYADNFARMYGYGSEIASALRKISDNTSDIFEELNKRNKDREYEILEIYKSLLSGVHGHDVQRLRSLIKEYDKDINNEDIPIETRKWLREDRNKLYKVLDMYTKDKDTLKSRINRMINDSMK